MTAEAILTQIVALPDADREYLFELLAERYQAPEVPPMTPELAKLLDERCAAADADPGAGIPWEVVYEESLKRARK